MKRVLDLGCAFPLPVNPVLDFFKPTKRTVESSLQDMRAIEDRELSALRPLPRVLSPEQVDAVYAASSRSAFLD